MAIDDIYGGINEEDVVSTSDPELLALPQQVCEAETQVSNSSSPFEYRRILLFAREGALTDTHKAVNIAYFTPAGEYILDFETEEDARAAYTALAAEFGTSSVMPDLPVNAESLPYHETAALSESWGVDLMQLDAARDSANSDSALTGRVTVAVLDSGISPDHELFDGRLAKNPASFVGGSEYSEDQSGHGTHVAGIIADGTSAHVDILPVKVLNDEGRGGFAEVINGIYYAAEQGADVINMSLAINLNDYGDYWSDTALLQEENALRYAEEKGCVCIAAAGNDSMNLDELKVYPAISEHTITISSITESKTRALSSNYGMSVDFTAPGDQILSAGTSGRENYVTKSGTSMAAPHISAACAMLKLYNGDLTVSGYSDVLRSLAVDLGTPGKDKKFGYGLIIFPEGKVPLIEEPAQPQPKVSIADSSVGMKTSAVFTGKPIKPEITVILEGKTLREGVDYNLAFDSNINVGTAKAKIIGAGMYEGTIIKSFRILPKGTELSKLKPAKKKVIVSWKKQSSKMAKSRVTGYQIQYNSSAQFRSGNRTVTVKGYSKKSRTIKGLKSKKKYYFRIRTYMKTASGTCYSAWSKVRYVKIK